MFNYIGRIVGDVQESKKVEFTNTDNSGVVLNSTTYGLDLYAVQIPAISQEPVAATVLSFPGIALKYEIDDIVLIGEIEEKSKAGFTYVILGALQKQDAINNIGTASVANIAIDTTKIKSGTINSSVKLVKNENASTSSNSIELTTLWNAANSIQSLNNVNH